MNTAIQNKDTQTATLPGNKEGTQRKKQKMGLWGRIARSPRGMCRLFNIFPPFLFAGVSMRSLSADFRTCVTVIKPSFFNRNLVSTVYGGSLFSATDAQFMVMLLRIYEGRGLEIWDKSATIEYLRPATSPITFTFIISDKDLDQIESALNMNGRTRHTFIVEGLDDKGRVCCRVHKVLSIKSGDAN